MTVPLVGGASDRGHGDGGRQSEGHDDLIVMVNGSFMRWGSAQCGRTSDHFVAGARMDAFSTITSTSTLPARSNTKVIRKLS